MLETKVRDHPKMKFELLFFAEGPVKRFSFQWTSKLPKKKKNYRPVFVKNNLSNFHEIFFWVHPFSTYAKFSEKLKFLTPWCAHVRVRIKGWEILVFRKFCLRTKWINPFSRKLPKTPIHWDSLSFIFQG